MNRRTTTHEQAPSSAPLRAKYLLHKTVILITDVSDADIKKIIDLVERNEHPPHQLVQ